MTQDSMYMFMRRMKEHWEQEAALQRHAKSLNFEVLEERQHELETENAALRSENHRLKAVEAEYARLKSRAERMEIEIDRLACLTRGEGNWECSNCGRPLHTLAEYEAHECMDPPRVIRTLEPLYYLLDPEAIGEFVWEQKDAEELLAMTVLVHKKIKKWFPTAELFMELWDIRHERYGGVKPKPQLWITLVPTEPLGQMYDRFIEMGRTDLAGFTGIKSDYRIEISVGNQEWKDRNLEV